MGPEYTMQSTIIGKRLSETVPAGRGMLRHGFRVPISNYARLSIYTYIMSERVTLSFIIDLQRQECLGLILELLLIKVFIWVNFSVSNYLFNLRK